MAYIADFVVETANSPGTSTTVNLIGAAGASYKTFASRFTSGSNVFYTISDETSQRETGIGVFTAGAPNTIQRSTVLANTLGTNARLNFIGPVIVYNEIPSSKILYFDAAGNIATITTLTVSDTITAGGSPGFVTGSTNPINTASTGIVIGTGGSAFYSAGGAALSVGSSVSSLVGWYRGSTQVGSISTTGSTTAYNTSSDYRLKKTFGLANVSKVIDSIPVHDAEFLSEPGQRRAMFLAHEVQEHIPAAVTGEKDSINMFGNLIPQEMDATFLVPYLWAEIQALRQRVEELEKDS